MSKGRPVMCPMQLLLTVYKARFPDGSGLPADLLGADSITSGMNFAARMVIMRHAARLLLQCVWSSTKAIFLFSGQTPYYLYCTRLSANWRGNLDPYNACFPGSLLLSILIWFLLFDCVLLFAIDCSKQENCLRPKPDSLLPACSSFTTPQRGKRYLQHSMKRVKRWKRGLEGKVRTPPCPGGSDLSCTCSLRGNNVTDLSPRCTDQLHHLPAVLRHGRRDTMSGRPRVMKGR